MFKPSSVVHTLRKIPILQCLPTVWFVGILPLACFPKLDDKTFGGVDQSKHHIVVASESCLLTKIKMSVRLFCIQRVFTEF